MFSRVTFAAAAVFGLLTSANAHLVMKSPVPITGSALKSPLDPSGSDFPCHGAQYVTGKGGQSFAVGSKQTLSFDLGPTLTESDITAGEYDPSVHAAYSAGNATGKFKLGGFNTAVHGGGSCQLSVTYETDATKVKDPTNWKVIYSIEGGCPTNTDLNLDRVFTNAAGVQYTGAYQCGDANANSVDCINSFGFTVPKELKNGKATFAWTWSNSVGNREFYMNCADVEVTGGSTDESAFDNLPSLFVANIKAGDSTCTNAAYQNYQYPNPGKYVTTKTADGPVSTSYPFAGFAGGAACTATGQAAAPAASSPAAGKATSAPAAATSAASGYIGSSAKATSTPAAVNNPGGILAPGAASAAKPSVTAAASPSTTFATAVATTTASSAAASVPVASASAASAPAASAPAAGNSSSGSCANGGVSCSNDGAIVCIDSDKWGLCDHGCAVPQALAAGMMCDAGTMKAASHKIRRHPHGLSHRHRF